MRLKYAQAQIYLRKTIFAIKVHFLSLSVVFLILFFFFFKCYGQASLCFASHFCVNPDQEVIDVAFLRPADQSEKGQRKHQDSVMRRRTDCVVSQHRRLIENGTEKV